MNYELIKRTEEFLKQKFDEAIYLNEHPEDKAYRIEHTYRVANIGRQIAQKEGFDETETVIACLLHDVSYCEEFGEKGWKDHGRRAAAIARPFLRELGFPEERISDICYGIAIHVDDEADFEGERTPFALSIGDADNIDRFDVYRIHETLTNDGFLNMEFSDKQEYVRKRLERLQKFIEMPLATKTAEELWRSRLSFYISFYEKLLEQLENSTKVNRERGTEMFERLDRFIEENQDEMLVTGGWGDEKIAELEKEAELSFREELKEFIRRYGLLLGYGVEIGACCRDGSSTVVEDTLSCRWLGLDHKYLVIENNDEIKYCLDNETGKIVNWGPDNGEAYPEADDLETFIMNRLEKGKENW